MVLSIVISAAIALVIFAIANKRAKKVEEVFEPQKEEEVTVISPELEYFPDVNFIEEKKEEVAVVEEEKAEPKKKKAPAKKKATTKAKPKK